MAEELEKGTKSFSLNKPDANVIPKKDNADETREGKPAKPDIVGTDAPAATDSAAGGGKPEIPEDETFSEMAAQSAVNHGGHATADGETLYSSHPIRNYKVGRFEFVNTLLRLSKADDIAEFEKLYAGLPQSEQLVIKKLDTSRVDAIVESRRMATKQFDSSLGREALERLQADNPTVGMQDIAHEKRPQQDNNVPVIPKEPVDPEGKTGLDQGAHVVEDSGRDSAV